MNETISNSPKDLTELKLLEFPIIAIIMQS